MGEKEDWLWRPVLAGHLDPKDLLDGTVDLELVATLNEAMDVQAENQRRYRAALQSEDK